MNNKNNKTYTLSITFLYKNSEKYKLDNIIQRVMLKPEPDLSNS